LQFFVLKGLFFIICTVHYNHRIGFRRANNLTVTPYNVLPPKEDQLFSDDLYLTRLFYSLLRFRCGETALPGSTRQAQLAPSALAKFNRFLR
jgi:hypothetical protein